MCMYVWIWGTWTCMLRVWAWKMVHLLWHSSNKFGSKKNSSRSFLFFILKKQHSRTKCHLCILKNGISSSGVLQVHQMSKVLCTSIYGNLTPQENKRYKKVLYSHSVIGHIFLHTQQFTSSFSMHNGTRRSIFTVPLGMPTAVSPLLPLTFVGNCTWP